MNSLLPQSVHLCKACWNAASATLIGGALFLIYRRICVDMQSVGLIAYATIGLVGLSLSELFRQIFVSEFGRNVSVQVARLFTVAVVLFTSSALATLWDPAIGMGAPFILTVLIAWQATRLIPFLFERREVTTRNETVAPRSSSRVTQSIRRTVSNDGTNSIVAELSHCLTAGDRHHSFHLAFCPPFESVPAGSVRQIGGPSASLTLAELRTYGARIDARLYSPTDQRAWVTIEFSGVVRAAELSRSPGRSP